MKWLLLVSRGDCDRCDGQGRDHLTVEGQSQIRWLSEKINAIIGVGRTLSIASPIPCAIQTANIIGSRVGFFIDTVVPAFLPADGRRVDEMAKDPIRIIDDWGRNYDVVIVSTHREFLEFLPTFWGARHGFTIPSVSEVQNGWARAINVSDGTVILLTP